MHPQAAERLALEEEALVKSDPAAPANVQLGHPGADPVRVELMLIGRGGQPFTVVLRGEPSSLPVTV